MKMNDEYPTWVHVIAGLIGFAAIAGISLLSFMLFAPSEARAAQIIPESCTEVFEDTRSLDGSPALGQDRCVDDTLTVLRSGVIQTDCSVTCDWDDGTRRTVSTRCPGRSWVYEDDQSDALCAEHGGVSDSQWYVTRFFQSHGMWQGPDSPLTAGTLRGPDKMTCDCLSGYVSSCVDFDAGPRLGPNRIESFMCHDVCGWEKGSLSRSGFYQVERDSLDCINAQDTRGPEVHCQCDGVALKETWCTDDPGACVAWGCEVHHTAPSSTRCVPVPGESDSDSDSCVGEATPATAGLNWLRFGVGLSHDCVDSLR
jgi:hypothetical protein